MRAAGAAVTLLFLAAARAAPPDPTQEAVDRLAALLRAGDAAGAAKALADGTLRDLLPRDPPSLHAICEEASDAAVALAEKGPAEAPDLAATLRGMAEAALAARPESLLARRARACASLAEGRILREAKRPVPAERFLHAADDFEAVYGGDPRTGGDLLACGESLAEGADLPGADATALWARAERCAALARERHSAARTTLARGAYLLLDRVRWGAAQGEKGVEARLEGVMAYIADAQRLAPDDLDLCTAYNEIVSLRIRLGLRKPAGAFRARTLDLPNGITIELPLSRHWLLPAKGMEPVYHVTPRGATVHAVVLHDYPWAKVCDFGEITTVKGDSLKDVAEKVYELCLGTLKTVKAKRPTARAQLRRCDPGWTFEVEGTDAAGAYSRRRGWHFKSKEGWLTSFEVLVYDYREGERDDPALEFVLDSVRERAKER